MDEWSEWVEHDGSGCPCIGEYVQLEYDVEVDATMWRGPSDAIIHGKRVEVIVRRGPLNSWNWRIGWARVIRYRIRKPKGLTILTNILREVERECEVV